MTSVDPAAVKKWPHDATVQHNSMAERQNLRAFHLKTFVFAPPIAVSEGYIMVLSRKVD
jgi:hypothetical protein